MPDADARDETSMVDHRFSSRLKVARRVQTLFLFPSAVKSQKFATVDSTQQARLRLFTSRRKLQLIATGRA